MSELNLEEIAKLLIEFEKLRKTNPRENSEDFRRMIRLDHILKGIILTGPEIVSLREYGYSLITDDDIKNSSSYTELKTEKDKLERKYERLERRYQELRGMIEREFASQFRLKHLIDRQATESIREQY